MKTIKRFKEGEPIPDNAKLVDTKKENGETVYLYAVPEEPEKIEKVVKTDLRK